MHSEDSKRGQSFPLKWVPHQLGKVKRLQTLTWTERTALRNIGRTHC